MAQISWRHHVLVQALISRGPLPEKEVHSIFFGVTGKNPENHSRLFNDYLLKINKELAYVQFELRGCRNQYDGEVYYGVVNNVSDEQSKLGSKYSVPQISFYKSIIVAIMQESSAQGCMSNIDALNIRLENQVQDNGNSQDSRPLVPAALKNFSLSQKEKTLHDLISDGWLCCTLNGEVGLGVRSFLDLRSWFRSNDIPVCEVCNEAGVKADLCSNGDCTVRIHRYCLEKTFSNMKVARVCPGCSTPWDVPVPNDQSYDKENDPYQSQEPSSGRSARERIKNCKNEAAEEGRPQSKKPCDGASKMRKRLRSCKAEIVDAVAEIAERTSSEGPTSRELRRSKRTGLGLR